MDDELISSDTIQCTSVTQNEEEEIQRGKRSRRRLMSGRMMMMFIVNGRFCGREKKDNKHDE